MTVTIPAQSQSHQPGVEKLMKPLAVHIRPDYKGSGKLGVWSRGLMGWIDDESFWL